MKRSRAVLAVLLLVAVMFFLSYLLTVLASRLLPQEGPAVEVKPRAEAAPHLTTEPMTANDYVKIAREYSLSAAFDASRLREDTIERGASMFPDSEPLLMLQREVRLGQMLSARPITEDALTRYSAYVASISHQYPDVRLDLARVLMRAQRVAEAISKLREFLAVEPDNVMAHFYLGEALAKSLRFADSAEHLSMANKRCSDYAMASALLDLVSKSQSICELAPGEVLSWEALANKDVSVEGLLGLGNLLLWLDEPAHAVRPFERVVELDSANVEAHIGLGKAYFRQSADYSGQLSPKDRLSLLYEAGKELDIVHLLRPFAEHSIARFAFDFQKRQMMRDWLMIASAITLYHRDTGQWPGRGYDWLFTDATGKLPHLEAVRDWRSKAAPCSDYLVLNTDNAPGWHGPYLVVSGSDPWEHCYLINVAGFAADKPSEMNVLCVSSGPNWILQTPAYAKSPSDDDLALTIMRNGRMFPDRIEDVFTAVRPQTEVERKWYTRLVSKRCDKMLLFGQKFPKYSRIPAKLYYVDIANSSARKVGDDIPLRSEFASVDWDNMKVYTVMRLYEASPPSNVENFEDAEGKWLGDNYLMEFDINAATWRPIFSVDDKTGEKEPIDVVGRVLFLPKVQSLFFCRRTVNDRDKPEHEYDIYRYGLKDHRLQLVTENIASVPGTPQQWFSVNNAGNMLFAVKDIGQYTDGKFKLHVIASDGKVKKVFSDGIDEEITDFYACSPNDKYLLFGTRPGKRSDPLTAELGVNLWVLSMPEMTVRRVVNTGQSYVTPQWEEDSATFSYLQWYRRQILQHDLSGATVSEKPLHEMAMDKLSWVNPQWSIEGDKVVYIAMDDEQTAAVWTTNMDSNKRKKIVAIPGL